MGSVFSFLFAVVFFFKDTATTEIYTLSLHDALPISHSRGHGEHEGAVVQCRTRGRSEEHTSELQSRLHIVCRLLLEKKKKKPKKLCNQKKKQKKTKQKNNNNRR